MSSTEAIQDMNKSSNRQADVHRSRGVGRGAMLNPVQVTQATKECSEREK